jgi:hypothetical protein
MELTQHEKIFIIILSHRDKMWWRASDFQRPWDNIFVGYEASARMSELAKMYPYAFDMRKNGRFRELSFNFHSAAEIYKHLPHELARHLVLQQIIK